MKILNKVKSMFGNKKGQVFDNVSALLIGLATLAITAVVVFLILSQTKSNSLVISDANATAAITTMQEGGDTAVNFTPLIVIAAVGAVLLGLIAVFRGRS